MKSSQQFCLCKHIVVSRISVNDHCVRILKEGEACLRIISGKRLIKCDNPVCIKSHSGKDFIYMSLSSRIEIIRLYRDTHFLKRPTMHMMSDFFFHSRDDFSLHKIMEKIFRTITILHTSIIPIPFCSRYILNERVHRTFKYYRRHAMSLKGSRFLFCSFLKSHNSKNRVLGAIMRMHNCPFKINKTINSRNPSEFQIILNLNILILSQVIRNYTRSC